MRAADAAVLVLCLNLLPAMAAEPGWTEAEQERGYVVFRHSTLALLQNNMAPARENILRDWNNISIDLARGEAESICLGVHNIQGPPLIDTWAEPTLAAADTLGVEVHFRDNEVHQLVPGKVIGRIPVGTTSGFWLTFRAGPDTAAGEHSIRLEIIPANHNRKETVLSITVNVRPFALPRARSSFGAYFGLSITGIPMGWVRYMQNMAWREACYRNMAAHGMTDVDIRPLGPLGTDAGDLLFGGEPNKGLLRLETELTLTQAAGLTDPETPVLLLEDQVPASATALARFGSRLAEYTRARRWPELLHYLWDEPPYPKPEVRARYLLFRDTPLRTVTSMGIHAAYGHGDLIDVWLMYGGHITPELRAEAKRLGAEVWTYSCHIGGAHPIRNRFYAGLYTWAHGSGGNWIWAYYRNLFHNRLVWSETADYRMFPRVGYLGRRDGTDDYRYLQLLEDAVAAKPDEPAAVEASAYLEALRERVADTDPHRAGPDKPLPAAEYDAIREQLAGYIERLGPVPSRAHYPWRAAGVRDEAAAYRGETVAECINGLAAASTEARRAAAWALFERGAAAAPAVPALAGLLGDADVRIPALRALEATGPGAAAAVPQIQPLLTHGDVFIRLGATYALRAIGTPALAGLRDALQDVSPHVAYVAGEAAAEIGEPAKVLVPELVANLRRERIPTTYGHFDGALVALKALGPATAAVAPAILDLYTAGERPELRAACLEILRAAGPAAAEPVRERLRSAELDEKLRPELEKVLAGHEAGP